MNTVATPCMIAVPSMLMVAPKGMVNDATELPTPRRVSTAVSVMGMVAALLGGAEGERHGGAHLIKKDCVD